MSFPFPEVNASLNGCATVLLSLGYVCIRLKKVPLHRLCMASAFLVSAVFLASYLTYHFKTGARTPFGGHGVWRELYYTMLISHILLAIVVVPLILRTLYLAIRARYAQHRAWARWTFPIWYYVSITGVLVYFFLYQWFPSQS